MKVSIVIPCFNEQDTIKDVILDAYNKFPKAEIIVVNDASTDDTLNILVRLPKSRYWKNGMIRLKILNNIENKGHAYSLIKGLQEAKGNSIIYIDADNQIRFSDFVWEIGYWHLMSGYRINRYDKPFRKVVSFILKMTIFLRYRMWINDANCPFKIFEKKRLKLILKSLPIDCIVPSIDLEILYRLNKWKTIEIPVRHHPYIKERTGSLQSINRKSLSMFWKAFKEVWTL